MALVPVKYHVVVGLRAQSSQYHDAMRVHVFVKSRVSFCHLSLIHIYKLSNDSDLFITYMLQLQMF